MPVPDENTNNANHGNGNGQGEHKSSNRIFLTLEPEKRISKWFLGVGSARKTARTVQDFQNTMLHGDEKHRYWVAALPQGDRDRLAGRVRVEAFIYIGIGLLFGGASFLDGVRDGLSGHVSSGLFWLFMGFLAAIIGIWVGTVKFWQAHNVQRAAHLSLLEFMKLRPSHDGSADSNEGV
ncbi:MAG: hypothetical protein ACYCQL_02905 [Acidithiobacillus sp.]